MQEGVGRKIACNSGDATSPASTNRSQGSPDGVGKPWLGGGNDEHDDHVKTMHIHLYSTHVIHKPLKKVLLSVTHQE